MLLKLKVLEPFLANYNNKLTGSEIAKKQKLNQKTVSTILKNLENEGFMTSTTQGKNKLYSLNKNDKTIRFITAMEQLKTIEFLDNNEIIRGIVEQITEHIDGIATIFGSYAKKQQKKNSDLDLFIIGKYDEKEITKISKMYRLNIDIKAYPRNIFRKAIGNSDFLVREVIKSHILILDTEGFIKDVFKHGKN